MQNTVKDWLVRTRSGEVLGPFTQRELLEEMKKDTFSPDDEIAPSQGQWISAQTLVNRDADEFTQTRTRNQTLTKSVHTHSYTPAPGMSGDRHELTPTPDFSNRSTTTNPNIVLPPTAAAAPAATAPHKAEIPDANRKPIGPVIITVALVVALWLVVAGLRNSAKNHKTTQAVAPTSAEGDSPFVQKIYALIHTGETQSALKQLSQYHEQSGNKADPEYLIPYAALLITEGEAPARGRKLLEGVLANPQMNAHLKSKAHHWLGYVALSQREGDMGESHFLEALLLDPKDGAAMFNLGRSYLEQDKFAKALDYLKLAELDYPDLWVIQVYKGRAKAALGNIEEARAAFNKALQLSPDRWITYIYHSTFLWQIREKEAAQATLKTMLTRDPNYEIQSPPPFGFYLEKVNYAEYLEVFSTVMSKANGEDKELGRLYLTYLLNGPGSAEANHLEQLGDSGNILAKVLALKVMLDRDATADALKHQLMRLPQQLTEFSYYAYVLRGEAESRLGLLAEAQQDFKRALVLEPASAASHWAYAILLRKTQHAGEADEEIRDLLAHHPNYIPAHIYNSHNF